MTGWVKLHRKLTDWEWYDDHATARLFIHLLLKAQHKASKWRGAVVPAGSLVTGRIKLSCETGLTEQQVRSSLKKLVSTDVITIKTTNRYSIIAVNNWEEHQDVNQQITNKATNKQPTDNQQITTCKNEKNEENEKIKTTGYSLEFEAFWKLYPKKKGKGAAARSFKKAKAQASAATLMQSLEKHLGCEDWKRDAGQFIPNPATWLNQSRWEDEPDSIAIEAKQPPPVIDKDPARMYFDWDSMPIGEWENRYQMRHADFADQLRIALADLSASKFAKMYHQTPAAVRDVLNAWSY